MRHSSEDDRFGIFEQGWRYLLVAVVATGVDWTLFGFAVEGLSVHHTVAASFSVVAGGLTSYLLSTRYVFNGGRFSRPVELFLVYSVSTMGLVLNVVFMTLLVDGLAFQPMSAKVFATCSLFLYNFVARRSFIFASEPDRSDSPRASRPREQRTAR